MAEAEANAVAEEEASARAEEQEARNPEEMKKYRAPKTISDTIRQEQVSPQASVTSAAASIVRRNIHKTVLSTAVKLLITAASVNAMRTPKNTMATALQKKNGRGIQGLRQTCHRYLARQRGLMRTNSSKGRTNYRSRPAPDAHNG